MWGFCKRKARAPRGKYTTVHEERLAMDAIYAAKSKQEQKEDAEMMEHVKVLTDFYARDMDTLDTLSNEGDDEWLPEQYDDDDWPDDHTTYTGAPDECSIHWPKKPDECGCNPVLIKEVDEQLEMLLNEEEMIELSYGNGDPLVNIGRRCDVIGQDIMGARIWRFTHYLGAIKRSDHWFDHAYIVAFDHDYSSNDYPERVVLLSQVRNVR